VFEVLYVKSCTSSSFYLSKRSFIKHKMHM